jgi:hypothetical protein
MEEIKNTWDLIKASIRVFSKYPKFLIPLLLVWLIYAPIILYLEYGFNPDDLSAGQLSLILLGIIFLFAFLLAFSCLVLLELIQQLESGEKLSLGKALSSAVTYDLLKILPIVIIWKIIWFILSILQAVFSERKEGRKSFTAENAAPNPGWLREFFTIQRLFWSIEKRSKNYCIFNLTSNCPGKSQLYKSY